MRLSTLLTIVIVHAQVGDNYQIFLLNMCYFQANVIYRVSNVVIDAGRNISTLFSPGDCPNGAELKFLFFPRVETST